MASPPSTLLVRLRAMPLPLAIPFGLLVGMSLAWMARAELARSEVPLVLARPFLVALGFAALVVAPVLGYFAALHGDWAYLYLVPWARVPSAVDLVVVAVAAAQVPLGFALSVPWAIAKRSDRFVQAGAACAAVGAALCALSWPRLSVSASYAQFHGAFGVVPIGQSSLGRGVLASWGALALGFGWSARVLRRP